MTKTQQVNENINLSQKLADFIAKNPKILNKYKGYSYVVFSSKDKTLNKMNNRVVEGLLEEGKSVVKAQETNDKKNPWVFMPVA